jgi:L-serine dehydratase
MHTLIIKAKDTKGSIAWLAQILANDHCNIATMAVSRKAKNDLAGLVIEMDSGLKPVSLDYMKDLDWVHEVIYIPDIDL